MLVTGPRAELLFGEGEVLVAARHLVDGRRVRVDPCEAVTYVHLLFDEHEIVWSEGAPSESLHPGAALGARLDAAQREEMLPCSPSCASARGGRGPRRTPLRPRLGGEGPARMRVRCRRSAASIRRIRWSFSTNWWNSAAGRGCAIRQHGRRDQERMQAARRLAAEPNQASAPSSGMTISSA